MRRIAIILVLALPSIVTAQRPWPAKPVKPTEIAKGRAYRIHAVPIGGGLLGIGDKSAFLLLHTSLPDGKLKILLASGESATLGPPMAIDRIFYKRTGIFGVVAPPERLVVLTKHAAAAVMLIPGAKKTPEYGKPYYQLTLYDARGRKKLSALRLTGVKIPKGTRHSIDAGPLKLKGNLITLFGRQARIEKDKLRLLPESAKPRK